MKRMTLSDYIKSMLAAIFIFAVIYFLVYVAIIKPRGDPSTLYTLEYEVFWTPTNIQLFKVQNHKGYYIGSDRGTNYIRESTVTGSTVICTSAPIRIVKYSAKKIQHEK